MLANVTFCLAVSTNFEGPGGIYKPMVNFAILLIQSDLCRLLEVMLEPRAWQGYGIFSPCVCLPKTDCHKPWHNPAKVTLFPKTSVLA